MTVGVLVGIAVVAGVVMLVVLFFRRGRDELDLSPRSLVRVYLYLASLAGLVLLVIGLASALTAGMAFAFGNEFAYGQSPRPVPAVAPAPCPPGQTCPPVQVGPPPQQLERERQQQERRRQEDLVRGVTFGVFGLVFWGAHRLGRRTLEGGDETSGLRRAYLLFATVAFGLATIVLLPTGLYQALSFALIPRSDFDFRPGVADALAGGIVVLPFWLYFLRTLTRELARPAAGAADVR